jgi:hypothetical protein
MYIKRECVHDNERNVSAKSYRPKLPNKQNPLIFRETNIFTQEASSKYLL